MVRPIKPTLQRDNNTLRQSLGAVITALRTKENLSQQDLGDKTGYSARYIIKVEKGQQNPSLDLIVAVAQFFGLNSSQLLAKAERNCLRHQSALKKH
jgi:transcriptional regulator with XRE-family HTH domain